MTTPKLLLSLQAVLVALSLLGYGIFTNYPELLAKYDPGARFYVWAFHGFAVANVLLGGLAVLGDAWRENRARIVVPFVLVYAISLLSELGGTTFGIPFGAYTYTELLGPKWFDKVPYVIPLSWFMMAWPAWILATRRLRGAAAVLLGSALLVAWDLVLDPAMSGATSYWVWDEPGGYYGMPWRNLVGWVVTGLALLAVLGKLTPEPKGDAHFAVAAYAVNLALPIGLSALNGFWIPALAGALTALAALAAAYPAKFPRLSTKEVAHGAPDTSRV